MTGISKTYIGKRTIYENQFDQVFKNTDSNSIIIFGPKGIGKSTFIHYYISQILEVSSQNYKSKLNHSKFVYDHNHPNVIFVDKERDEKTKKIKNNILIDQIRKIETFISHSSLNNLQKFVIIDNADDLNLSASNSLLKLLEEPNKKTYIILIAHQLTSLLPTIRSRCVKIKFNNLNYDEFSQIVLSNINNIDNSDIKFLYDISNGSPGIANLIYTENILKLYHQIIEILMDQFTLSFNIIEISSFVEKQNNDNCKSIFSIIKFILLNLLKINTGVDIKNNFISNIPDTFYTLSKKINSNKCLKGIEYININENNVFTYNLDKKVFVLNLFNNILKN